MVDYSLIKKILWEYGIHSVDVRGLKLVRSLLTGKEDIDLVRKIYSTDLGIRINEKYLIECINEFGINNLYIGERMIDYSMDELMPRGGDIEEQVFPLEINYSGKRTTLFKHDENDYYYYDLLGIYLGERPSYEEVTPNSFYLRYACDDMICLASILGAKKGKEMVK